MFETISGMADYLQTQKWDAFFTATFKQHQRYSAKAIDKVASCLSEPRLHPVKMFIAAEQHRLGGWHCHGLLEFPETKWHDSMVDFQRLSLGYLGFNRVGVVHSTNACSMYLAKYLTKDEWHGDWRMTGRVKFWQPMAGMVIGCHNRGWS